MWHINVFINSFTPNWFSVIHRFGKSVFQVPDIGTWVLDNAGPVLRSSIVSLCRIDQSVQKNVNITFLDNTGTPEMSIHQYWDVLVSGTWSILFPQIPLQNLACFVLCFCFCFLSCYVLFFLTVKSPSLLTENDLLQRL